MAMVLFGLWMARFHIRDVFVKAFRGDRRIDDSDEMLSYRVCAFGLLLSLIFLIFWFQAVGISWAVAIVLTLGIFITYLGTARVIAETGVIYFSMPMTPQWPFAFYFWTQII